MMLPNATEKSSMMKAITQKACLVSSRAATQPAAQMFNLSPSTRPADAFIGKLFSTFVSNYMNCNDLLNRLEEVKGETTEPPVPESVRIYTVAEHL